MERLAFERRHSHFPAHLPAPCHTPLPTIVLRPHAASNASRAGLRLCAVINLGAAQRQLRPWPAEVCVLVCWLAGWSYEAELCFALSVLKSAGGSRISRFFFFFFRVAAEVLMSFSFVCLFVYLQLLCESGRWQEKEMVKRWQHPMGSLAALCHSA